MNAPRHHRKIIQEQNVQTAKIEIVLVNNLTSNMVKESRQ